MIKTGLLFALLGPMLFRPRETMKPSNDALPPLPERPLPPAATVAPSVARVEVEIANGGDVLPWPELPELKSPEQAVAELIAELADYHGAGKWLLFSRIGDYYLRFGARNLWPVLSDRTLSRQLCALGCERGKPKTRNAEGRRPSWICLVPAQAVDDEEEVGAQEEIATEFDFVPMRLAA